MSYMVKDNGSNFERPKPGMHAAVCMGYYPIGKQPSNFADQPPKEKVIVVFEIDQRITKGDFAGQRFVQSKEYTSSLSEKANLRKDLESWRGRKFTEDQLKGFDMDNIVGKPCTVNLLGVISAKGKTYTNIVAIGPLMDGMEAMQPELPKDHIFEWIEEKKAKAIDDNPIPLEAEGTMEPNDRIPF